MFGLIQRMLEFAVLLKPQQMTLGEELLHGTLEMPWFSLFPKAIYNRNPNCLELMTSRKHRKALCWSNLFWEKGNLVF